MRPVVLVGVPHTGLGHIPNVAHHGFRLAKRLILEKSMTGNFCRSLSNGLDQLSAAF